MTFDLTIVMYHYVRDLERTRFPNIKGRRTAEFRSQLEYLRRHYYLVTMEEVVHAERTGDPLPKNAALMTFDDGYLEHFTTCFPILFDAGIQGSFFPPVAPVVRSELLDVNRVHFLLAVADPAQLAQNIDENVRRYANEYSLPSPEIYWADWAKASRFDIADVVYVKRMLQVALPEVLRNKIAKDLFSRYVSEDEASFASELYATEDQFRVMQSSGMYVGAHGDSHYWLNSVNHDVQADEIEGSLGFLRRVGSPIEDYWVMCYPYGAWDAPLLETLEEYNCTLGFTTEPRVARLGEENPLLLPRLDTNDLALRSSLD